MDFRILGSLAVYDDGEKLAVGTPRVRAVLAILLATPGRLVSVERLVDEMWPESPSPDTSALVHSYVSRLRRVLRSGPTGPAAARRLVTRRPGYLLEVAEHELDLYRYQRLVADARAARKGGAPQDCVALLRQADQLWHGSPFADVPSTPTVTAAATTLAELRLTILEERFEVALDAGHGEDLVVELTELVTEHPLRERLVGQLMLALHRAGRTADALAAYQRTKRRLVADLGVDPHPELREIELAMLRGDLVSSARTVHHTVPPPAQLPPDLPTFIGRTTELANLLALPRSPAPVVVRSIDGMAGIGKTSLAVHAAHQLAAHFPGGQLFINLHGNTQGMAPVTPAAALDQLLRALGESGDNVPRQLETAAALYRSRVAGRRLLVVLDDAATEEQVRHLLPGASGCLVIVTSRRRLAGLENAVPLTLDLPSVRDAVSLFTTVATTGPTGDDTTLRSIVEMCGRLPLAIHLAAARLRARPGWTLDYLATRLRDHRRRLSELAAGRRSVAATFNLSHQHLAAAQQRAFRLLGLHPGADIDAHATAALIDATPEQARELLEDLVDVHLLQEPEPDRYHFHDLVRQHAAAQAHAQETPAECDVAMGRLVDYYVHTAHAADRLLTPNRRPTVFEPPPPDGRALSFSDVNAAYTWFDTEYSCLLAVQRSAAARGWHSRTWRLAWTLDTYQPRRGRLHDQVTTWQHGLTAAEHLGDQAARCLAHLFLGTVYSRLRQHAEAMTHLGAARVLAGQTGDRRHRAHIEWALTREWHLDEDDELALAHATNALRLFESLDDPVWTAYAHNGVGWLSSRLGDHVRGLNHCATALAIFNRHPDPDGHACTLDGLAYIAHHTGRNALAIDLYQQALQLFRKVGNAYSEADTLESLGTVQVARGDHDGAVEAWREALRLYTTQDLSTRADRVARLLDTMTG